MSAVASAAILLAHAAAGALIGWLFFAALWLTVKRLPGASRPGLLLMASLATRLGLAGTALYLLAGDSLPRLAAALIGLLAARALWLHRVTAQGLRR